MAGLSKTKPPAANQTVFLLGKPVAHSLSPLLQNAAFRSLKLNYFYAPLELEAWQLGSFFKVFKGTNVCGANVTVPYKEKVMAHLDAVEKDASWLGSVNTLYKKNGKIWGTSTDGEGFLLSLGSLRKKLPGTGGLLLGAGGAAKAVAGALAGAGIRRLWIANRSSARAAQLAKTIQKRYPRLETGLLSFQEAQKLLPRVDWVVQATSIGLKPGDPSLLSLEKAPKSIWAADLIYNRLTQFLREAKSQKLACVGGGGMLLYQGALAFEKWTGRKAPLKVMRLALRENLN
jgi:shikimate dehydrogenase